MHKHDKIYIAGHRGMVGSAIHRKLVAEGYDNLIFRTSSELDLRNQKQVEDFLEGKTRVCFFSSCKSWGYLCEQYLSS